MPADHAHLAAQKLDTVREDTSCQWEPRLRGTGERERGHRGRRPGGPRLAEPDFHFIQDVFAGGQVKYQVAGEGPPSKLLSPGLSALSSPARLLLCSVLQEARAEANRSQGVSPQTSLSLPRLSAPEAVEVPASTSGPGVWTHSSLHCGVGVASCCGWSLGHPLPCVAPSNTTACDHQPPVLTVLCCKYSGVPGWIHQLQNMYCFLQISLSSWSRKQRNIDHLLCCHVPYQGKRWVKENRPSNLVLAVNFEHLMSALNVLQHRQLSRRMAINATSRKRQTEYADSLPQTES